VKLGLKHTLILSELAGLAGMVELVGLAGLDGLLLAISCYVSKTETRQICSNSLLKAFQHLNMCRAVFIALALDTGVCQITVCIGKDEPSRHTTQDTALLIW